MGLDEIFAGALVSTIGLFLFGLSRSRATVRELRGRVAAEERAKEMAMHDALTGLPNRRHLQAALGTFLTEANDASPLAVVAIDLDRFKPVNDLYGHAVGDELLIKIAETAAPEAGADGFVARLGGDEFVLALAAIRAKTS